jgi:hypothetical protein
MPRVAFDRLPADARLWIFPAGRALSEPEQARVLDEADAFIAQWTAHGMSLTAARDMRYGQFVLIGVDERAAGASGCSIDALVRRMRGLQADLGVELLDHGPIVYRRGESIARASREEFAALVTAGDVTLDTIVFDNTLTTVGGLRDGRWEVRAGDSWHARVFF